MPIATSVPKHNGVGRTRNRLGMGHYGREPKPLVEARISTVECLQITIDARVVGVSERWFNEALADTLALGRRRHADNGQIPGCLGNYGRCTWPH